MKLSLSVYLTIWIFCEKNIIVDKKNKYNLYSLIIHFNQQIIKTISVGQKYFTGAKF